ncbi:hypothetical protein CEP54_011434 [Fusarium duplospermum]|uniref:Alpha/beta hydrolase fold-3 domain-containing protein n=1 Tax=Fusarium duplospermum TaxID=1325734 RepID=A0A428PEI8_9HYPO|nr:hypothetical protein CEP54_011434 [Fusarium duplospermum]
MDKITSDERDPILQAAIDQRPFPGFPFEPENRGDRRRHLDGVSHLLPAPRPIPEFYRHASDGNGKRPLVVLFHEGGWVMGDSTDEDSNTRIFARDLGCVILNPEYRLAPEFLFPTGVLDCWDVLKWATQASLGADPSTGFIIGGSSAGANVTSVLAHLAAPSYWSMALMWTNRTDPVLPPQLDGPSDKTAGFISTMLKADVYSPLFSPFAEEWYPGAEDKRRPPRTFFQVAGLDPLRDHALVYQKVLEDEWHVPTRLNLYERHGHMFWTNWPQIGRSNDYWRDMVDGMGWLLADEGTS